MFEVKFDLHEFERKAIEISAAIDQVPFALSLSLNRAAVNARRVLVQSTWPRSVTVRNPGFISRALRTKFATKRDLRIEIYDDLHRAHLEKHARSGVKKPRGLRLAIPVKGRVTYTQHGVKKAQRPRALIDSTPKRALRITPKGIFVGQGGRLHLMYSFSPQAQIKHDVNFIEDFNDAIRQEIPRNFMPALVRAMKTRRR